MSLFDKNLIDKSPTSEWVKAILKEAKNVVYNNDLIVDYLHNHPEMILNIMFKIRTGTDTKHYNSMNGLKDKGMEIMYDIRHIFYDEDEGIREFFDLDGKIWIQSYYTTMTSTASTASDGVNGIYLGASGDCAITIQMVEYYEFCYIENKNFIY